MSDILDNRARVFRIGRECYVLYLGSDMGDFRPFLRIGNMPNLPDEIHKAVSTIIVAENHVGNPLQEVISSSKAEKRYIGDTSVAGVMRRFFQSFNLSIADNVTDYKTIKDGEKRHMVWFYSNGNIHLHFDDEVIFDLGRREREDRHFSKQYEDARELLLRNSARYIRHDFKGPGIISVRGNAFWYENGKFLSLNTERGFVTGLIYAGIDPSYVEASAVNIHQNQIESPGVSALFGFAKHFRRMGRTLRIITSLPDLPQKLKLLFPAREGKKTGISISNVGEGKRATFEGSIVSFNETMWTVRHAGFPDVFFGSTPRNGLSVNLETDQIQLRSSEKSSTFRLLEGLPINLLGYDFPKNDAIKKYIVLGFDRARNLLTEKAGASLSLLSKYIVSLEKELEDGREEPIKSLKIAAQEAENALRRIQIDDDRFLWFYLSNAEALLSFMIAEKTDSNFFVKTAKSLISLLRTSINRIKEPTLLSPFMGDLYTGKYPILMWRPAKNNLSQADLESASVAKQKIVLSLKEDRSIWNENLQRLLALIESLSINEKGSLNENQIALLYKGIEKEKAVQEPEVVKKRAPLSTKTEQKIKHSKQDEKSSSSPPPPIERSVSRTAAPLNLPGGGGSRKTGGSQSSSRKMPLRALFGIIPILIILGLVAWDLSGTAFWGRFLEGERTKKFSDLLTRKSESIDSDISNLSDETQGSLESLAEDDEIKPNDTNDTNDDLETQSSVNNTERESILGGNTTRSSNLEDDSAQEELVLDNRSVQRSSSAGTKKIDDKTTPSNTTIEIASEQATPDEEKSESGSASNFSLSDPDDSFQAIDNRIPVTLADIHLAANEIATLNGYKDLDYRVYTGEDPDWIFPGINLKMPENQSYVVKEGDTIWLLAVQEIRRNVGLNLVAYDKAFAALKINASDSSARENMRKIATKSKASAMRKMASRALLQ